LSYVRSLGYFDDVNYVYIEEELSGILSGKNYLFDWERPLHLHDKAKASKISKKSELDEWKEKAEKAEFELRKAQLEIRALRVQIETLKRI